MSNTQKTLLVLGLIVLIGAIYGGYVYPVPQYLVGASPAGSTFATSKTAGVAVNLANPGANGTSTSILNTDTNDRYVSSFHVGCENVGTSKTAYAGAGLANLQISIGTTTAPSPASFLSAAPVAVNFSIPTTTVDYLVSSSTLLTATSTLAAVWPTGTYMTFFFNATNTAACTAGVDYFGS